LVAGAQLPGDCGGRAVGEEDRDVDQRGQRLGGYAKAAERRRAQPADDRRVGQQEQRLGDECPEGWDGQPQDLGVTPAAPAPRATGWSG